MILVDDRLTCQFTNTHNTVSMVHSVLLNAVDCGVYFATRTVEIRCMHMDAKWLAANHLGVDTCWICKPVVGMNKIELFASGQDARNDGEIINLSM